MDYQKEVVLSFFILSSILQYAFAYLSYFCKKDACCAIIIIIRGE